MFLAANGIYKSIDDGDSWNRVFDGSLSGIRGYISDIEFGTNQSNIGYASFHGGNWNTLNAGVLKTVDNGDTWTLLNSNLPQTRIIEVVINP